MLYVFVQLYLPQGRCRVLRAPLGLAAVLRPRMTTSPATLILCFSAVCVCAVVPAPGPVPGPAGAPGPGGCIATPYDYIASNPDLSEYLQQAEALGAQSSVANPLLAVNLDTHVMFIHPRREPSTT